MQLSLALFLGLSYDPFPDNVRDLFIFPNSSGHPVSDPMDITAPFPGLKPSECESNHSSFSAGIMNGWSYTLTQPHIIKHGVRHRVSMNQV
jgi:hypothetical protein